MYQYVIERGGVSHDERGYMRGKGWASLYRARKFRDERTALDAYKASGLEGGVLIRTDRAYDTWDVMYTI
tara:strand:- start:198 stop:407 length:210 start_codon:yes stop_codon:yes gene_type:complete